MRAGAAAESIRIDERLNEIFLNDAVTRLYLIEM
jgi:hypothetical protein